MQGHYSMLREGLGPGRLQLHMPPAYTSCVQHLPDTSTWLLPSRATGTWLCIRPSAA